MNWKRAVIPALFIIPFMVVLGLAFGTDPHAVPNMLIGNPAPNFKLQRLDGQPFDSASLRGKPVVLNFWSTWCEPCKLEHELLQRGAKAYGDAVQFIGVVYQDESVAAQRYLSKRTNVYPQLHDPDSQVAIEYGVSGVPESFFLDANGVVHHKEAGVVSGPLLSMKIGELLKAGSGGAK